PHGGGGPGVGPIGVAEHLVPFLPAQASLNEDVDLNKRVGPVSAAPYGSASILTISWMYIRMMGATGLTEATKIAILNANYVAKGKADRQSNGLKNAPHTARQIAADKWDRPYSRDQAAFPAPWTRENKFWPSVARIDNVYGDRNLFCSCPPLKEFSAE